MIDSERHYEKIIFSLSFLSLSNISTTCHANTFGNLDIGIINDDNLTHSDYETDKKAGTALKLFVDYGKLYDLNNNWSAIASIFSQDNINDKVFGTGLTAYHINTTTVILKISLSYAVNDIASINAGYEHQNSSLAYGIDYTNNLLRANCIYSF